ncbi:hypothetical protein NTGM5_560007 [Candidatus Nitrotoga sp. M5]|nr:hypothetical protein NTGM5_560007 [Candidatus Nitrotoga sp. M5]
MFDFGATSKFTTNSTNNRGCDYVPLKLFLYDPLHFCGSITVYNLGVGIGFIDICRA